jgi:uncharacterized protein (DUF2236 family)
MGREQLRACTSLLGQAMRHLLRLHLQPDGLDRLRWLEEVDTLLADAGGHYSPSMRQRIDMQRL